MEVQDLTEEDFFKTLEKKVPETSDEIVKEELLNPATEVPTKTLTENELLFLSGSEVEEGDTKKESTSGTVTSNKPQESFETDKDSFYKARVDYAKTLGRLPEDFELEDDVVLDDDAYTKIMDYENQYVYDTIASQVRQDYVEKLGDNLIKFVEAGGDVSKIAELVKAQNEVTQLSTATQSGQKAIVTKYYTDVLKWKPERLEKHIDRLIVDGDLEKEANDVKEDFDESFQKEQAKLVEKQQERFDKQQEMEKKQINSFASVLESEGMTKKDINEYIEYAFVDIELSNGMKMPKLDLKILQIQKDPKELLELIQFIDNKKEFLKRKAIEINNPKVDKTFEAILKNKNSSKTTGTPELKKTAKTEFKFNF